MFFAGVGRCGSSLPALSPSSLLLILWSYFSGLFQSPLVSLSGPNSQRPQNYLLGNWGWGGSETSYFTHHP